MNSFLWRLSFRWHGCGVRPNTPGLWNRAGTLWTKIPWIQITTFWFVALVLIFAGIIVVRLPARQDQRGAEKPEMQRGWTEKIDQVSKLLGPLLAAYVTVELTQRLAEQWLGHPIRIWWFPDGNNIFSLVVSILFSALFIMHWLHSAYEGRYVLAFGGRASFITLLLVLLVTTTPAAPTELPMEIPYIDPFTGRVEYREIGQTLIRIPHYDSETGRIKNY